MAQLVDIRKFTSETSFNELVEASKITKNWWGKKTDNYWPYLSNTAKLIELDLNTNIIIDLFAYIIDDLGYKESHSDYSEELFNNRGSFTSIISFSDKENLLEKLNLYSFFSSFKSYAQELNAEFYDYTDEEIKDNLQKFRVLLTELNSGDFLLISIG